MSLIDLSQPYYMTERAARHYLAAYRDVLAKKAAGENIRSDDAPSTQRGKRATKQLDGRGGESVPTGRVNSWGETVYSNWYLRDGVATLDITGPIMRYGGWMAAFCGLTSTQQLARDFEEMLSHADVQSIILNFDTPGGISTSIDEFARRIYSSRGNKRVVAYGDGLVCSAGCYLATPCDEVVLSHTAFMGSIGTIMGWLDDREQLKMEGLQEIEFVSSQSPLKNPDPLTKDGKASYQRIVDDMTQIFGEAVALFRGTTAEDVFANYGRGDILIAERAVKVALADRISDYETLHTELRSAQTATRTQFSTRNASTQQKTAPQSIRVTGGIHNQGVQMKNQVAEEREDEQNPVVDDDGTADVPVAKSDADGNAAANDSARDDSPETDAAGDDASGDNPGSDTAQSRAKSPTTHAKNARAKNETPAQMSARLAQQEQELAQLRAEKQMQAREKFNQSLNGKVPLVAREAVTELYNALDAKTATTASLEAFIDAIPQNELFAQVEGDREPMSEVKSPVPPDPDTAVKQSAASFAEKQNARRKK